MKELKFRESSTVEIKEALDALSQEFNLEVEYDQNSSRSDLWSLYKQTLALSKEAQAQSVPDEDGDAVFTGHVDPVVHDKEALDAELEADTPDEAQEVTESESEETEEDSQEDSPELPPPTLTAQSTLSMLQDGAIILDELANLPMINRIVKFMKTGEHIVVKEEELSLLVKLLGARRNHIRFNEGTSGPAIYAGEMARAYYDLQYEQVATLHAQMIAALKIRASRLNEAQREQLEDRAKVKWISLTRDD